MASVLEAAAVLREVLAGFEPALLSGTDCARVAEALAATEKACSAAGALAAARAVEVGAHRDRGFADGAAWLAAQSGSTGSDARRALQTARSLEDCPDTKAAWVAGEVSLDQAREIIEANEESPGVEAELLAVAKTADLSRLKERARERRSETTPVHDLHRQQRQARQFHHWRDRLGMVCFRGALPPEVGVGLIHRLELATFRARKAARADGGPTETWEAHAADALASMLTGGGGRGDRADLVIVCDINAWRRGHSHPGEACHLLDGGPIPVSVAKELTRDAFLKAVLHDGVNIHTIRHFGRYQPAELRTALDLGPVPAFTGAQCTDCGRRYGLEYDHVDPVANHGPTSYQNLQPRCWADHHAKTERDRQAGLLRPKPP